MNFQEKMRTLKLAKINAALIALLGLTHNILTFTKNTQRGLTVLDHEKFNAVIYMSLISGTSFILIGILLLYLLSRFEKVPILYTPLLIISSYLVLTGIFSSILLSTNLFAWLAFFIKITMLIFVIILGKSIKDEN